MKSDIESKIEKLTADLEVAVQKLEEQEAVGEQAGGKLSESFEQRLADLRHNRDLLTEHISALELEKAQAWQQSNLGNDLGDMARSLIDRASSLLQRFSRHQD